MFSQNKKELEILNEGNDPKKSPFFLCKQSSHFEYMW